MTEIAVRNDQPTEVATFAPAAASLVQWAEEVSAAHALATKLVLTSFVPDFFKGKPHEAAAAILTGRELGLSPLASLRAIFVIKGTPGMYAKAMVAVVMAKGHEVWVEEQSDDRVIVCGQRKGSVHVYRTVWDRARVVKAKLTGNAKYQENPQQMMTARGQAEISRQVAPDALLGIPYSVEELYDMPGRAEATPEFAPPARVTAAEILGTTVVDAEPVEDAGDEWPATAPAGGAEAVANEVPRG